MQSTETPVSRQFLELIRDRGSDEDYYKLLQDHPPSSAELVTNTKCGFQCAHCIYPSSFNQVPNLDPEEWKRHISRLIHLGFETFVFGGRATNSNVLDIAHYTKKAYPETKVGVIADGPQVGHKKTLDTLLSINADWCDISVDGTKEPHETQRRAPNSYEATLDVLQELQRNSGFSKINVLSCVTEDNRESIPAMIQNLRDTHGVQNFHVTPVNRPQDATHIPQEKVPRPEKFMELVHSLEDLTEHLPKTYIRSPFYENRYVNSVLSEFGADAFRCEGSELNRIKTKENDSIFEINCNFPALIACEGLIMLSDMITPHKVMMYGNAIPQEHIMGYGNEMLHQHNTRHSFWDALLDSPGMNYYVDEFRTAKEELSVEKIL